MRSFIKSHRKSASTSTEEYSQPYTLKTPISSPNINSNSFTPPLSTNYNNSSSNLQNSPKKLLTPIRNFFTKSSYSPVDDKFTFGNANSVPSSNFNSGIKSKRIVDWSNSTPDLLNPVLIMKSNNMSPINSITPIHSIELQNEDHDDEMSVISTDKSDFSFEKDHIGGRNTSVKYYKKVIARDYDLDEDENDDQDSAEEGEEFFEDDDFDDTELLFTRKLFDFEEIDLGNKPPNNTFLEDANEIFDITTNSKGIEEYEQDVHLSDNSPDPYSGEYEGSFEGSFDGSLGDYNAEEGELELLDITSPIINGLTIGSQMTLRRKGMTNNANSNTNSISNSIDNEMMVLIDNLSKLSHNVDIDSDSISTSKSNSIIKSLTKTNTTLNSNSNSIRTNKTSEDLSCDGHVRDSRSVKFAVDDDIEHHRESQRRSIVGILNHLSLGKDQDTGSDDWVQSTEGVTASDFEPAKKEANITNSEGLMLKKNANRISKDPAKDQRGSIMEMMNLLTNLEYTSKKGNTTKVNPDDTEKKEDEKYPQENRQSVMNMMNTLAELKDSDGSEVKEEKSQRESILGIMDTLLKLERNEESKSSTNKRESIIGLMNTLSTLENQEFNQERNSMVEIMDTLSQLEGREPNSRRSQSNRNSIIDLVTSLSNLERPDSVCSFETSSSSTASKKESFHQKWDQNLRKVSRESSLTGLGLQLESPPSIRSLIGAQEQVLQNTLIQLESPESKSSNSRRSSIQMLMNTLAKLESENVTTESQRRSVVDMMATLARLSDEISQTESSLQNSNLQPSQSVVQAPTKTKNLNNKQPSQKNKVLSNLMQENRYSWYNSNENMDFMVHSKNHSSPQEESYDESLLDEINSLPVDFDFEEIYNSQSSSSGSALLNNTRFYRSNSYNKKPSKVVPDTNYVSNKIETTNKTVTFYGRSSNNTAVGARGSSIKEKKRKNEKNWDGDLGIIKESSWTM